MTPTTNSKKAMRHLEEKNQKAWNKVLKKLYKLIDRRPTTDCQRAIEIVEKHMPKSAKRRSK